MSDPILLQPLPPDVKFERGMAAMHAARAGAQGRNRDQVRELLVAELRARGLMLPSPEVEALVHRLEALVDLDARRPAPRQAERLAKHTKLAGLAGLAFRSRFLGPAIIRRLPAPATTARFVHSTLPDQPTRVILDRDASEHLAVGEADTFVVWFGPAAASSPDERSRSEAKDATDQPLAVFRGDYQVGVLDPDASAAWRPRVQEGHDESRTVSTYAIRQQADNGEWRLLVGLPHARSTQPGNEDDQV